MNFDFLKNVTLEEVPVKKKSGGTTKIVKTPGEGADFRIYPDGKIYPSEAFALKHNLMFKAKVDGEYTGNGIDIFSSDDWGMIKGKIEQTVVFLSVIKRGEPKIDMWGSCSFDEEGNPKTDIFTQGKNTFSKTRLVAMLESAFNLKKEEVKYFDIKVEEEQVIAHPSGVYHLPKVVSSGEHKGEPTYQRRENITICPISLVEAPVVVVDEVSKPDLSGDSTKEAMYEDANGEESVNDLTDQAPTSEDIEVGETAQAIQDIS